MIFSATRSFIHARRAFLRGLAALLLVTGTITGTAHAVPPPATPLVLVVGDSLSAEYGLQRGQGWVALMEKRLKVKHPNYSVVNASISGDTTSGGANRLPGALSQHRPAIVVIELGSNDALRGLSMDATRANLETMIKASQDAGAKVLLIGMQLPPNFGREFNQKFRGIYPELGKKYKVPVVPFLLEGIGEKTEMFQADGLHPLAQAEPHILDNVWPQLEPLLKGGSAKR